VLYGINPLLHGDGLRLLDGAGHGDGIIVADGNFPARTLGLPVVVMSTTDVAAAIRATASVIPPDGHAEYAYRWMSPDPGAPGFDETRQSEALAELCAWARTMPGAPVARSEFYDLARSCALVIQTIDYSPYCDFILVKGVVVSESSATP
jgi:L-fucose mutarotase